MPDLSEPIRKPAGNIRIIPHDGSKEQQGDTLQCAHCGAVFAPMPGSGKRRGYCFRHAGPLCGQDACIAMGCRSYEQYIEELEFVNFTPKELVSAEQYADSLQRIQEAARRRTTIVAATRA